MSSNRDFWEARFIDTFVTKSKRSRYKKFLRDSRKRDKILDRLNHNADFDFSQAIKLSGNAALPWQLVQKLQTYKVDAQCWLISDDSELDCKLLPLSQGAELTASAEWGTIMICPQKPIVVYRPEASEGSLYLFT